MDFKESFLHHIWDQRHLSSELESVSGKRIKIIYQGQYNAFNGPDFKNAVVSIGEDTLRGDVEIHHKTSDWLAHHHHEDAAYNNTILHVVFEHLSQLPFTIKEDATQTEILEIKKYLSSEIEKLLIRYNQAKPTKYQSTCDFFTLFSNDQLMLILREYGWQRFIRKSNRFSAELPFSSFDQLLYNGFMETMGYEKNKFNTSALAHRFNWELLSDWKSDGLDADSLISIWLNFSKLTDAAEKIMSAEKSAEIRNAWEKQRFTSEIGNLKWNLFRIRPANHPVRRLFQAGQIINSVLETGFLTNLLNIIERLDDTGPSVFVNNISNWINGFIKQIANCGTIGTHQIKTIIGNCFLPIVYMYAEKVNNSKLKQKIQYYYLNFPPENSNNITAFMQGYMKEDTIKQINTKYILQQGLIQLYYMYCNYHMCDLCMHDKHNILKNM